MYKIILVFICILIAPYLSMAQEPVYICVYSDWVDRGISNAEYNALIEKACAELSAKKYREALATLERMNVIFASTRGGDEHPYFSSHYRRLQRFIEDNPTLGEGGESVANKKTDKPDEEVVLIQTQNTNAIASKEDNEQKNNTEPEVKNDNAKNSDNSKQEEKNDKIKDVKKDKKESKVKDKLSVTEKLPESKDPKESIPAVVEVTKVEETEKIIPIIEETSKTEHSDDSFPELELKNKKESDNSEYLSSEEPELEIIEEQPVENSISNKNNVDDDVPPAFSVEPDLTTIDTDEKISFTESEIEEFKTIGQQKFKQFENYLMQIGSNSTPSSTSSQAIDNALLLFDKESRTIEVSSVNSPVKIKRKIRDYLNRLRNLQYDNVRIEWADLHYTSDFVKAPDGTYRAYVVFSQRFTGIRGDNVSYEDITTKRSEVIVKAYDKAIEGEIVKSWEVFLGDISVTQTQAY